MSKRVKDPADPNRCQCTMQDGQCMNRAEEGVKHCLYHGGVSTAPAEEKRLYHLTQARYRTRLAQLSEHGDVKTLRDEIALARTLIEARFNLITNDTDLLLHCGEINRMLITVERLVKSAHLLEQNLGVLLARDTVLRLGQSLCEILVEELADVPDFENVIDRITDRIIPTITHATNKQTVGAARLIGGPSVKLND